MIRIYQLGKDPGRSKKRIRVGRGEASGKGKTSGRGSKGAQSRSGYRTRPGFEGGQTPIQRRLPKKGFKNRDKVCFIPINLSQLERFENDSVVDIEVLRKNRLVKGKTPKVKILGKGELTRKLTVKAHGFSQSAQEKITSLGGSCEVI